MLTETRIFWKSPSGRIHSMRTCSGAGPANRMERIFIDHDEWREYRQAGQLCRCGWNTDWHIDGDGYVDRRDAAIAVLVDFIEVTLDYVDWRATITGEDRDLMIATIEHALKVAT